MFFNSTGLSIFPSLHLQQLRSTCQTYETMEPKKDHNIIVLAFKYFHSSMEYIKIISIKTTKPKIIASLLFPVANSAVVASANTII